jgi:hypothetical protein
MSRAPRGRSLHPAVRRAHRRERRLSTRTITSIFIHVSALGMFVWVRTELTSAFRSTGWGCPRYLCAQAHCPRPSTTPRRLASKTARARDGIVNVDREKGVDARFGRARQRIVNRPYAYVSIPRPTREQTRRAHLLQARIASFRYFNGESGASRSTSAASRALPS